MNKEEILQAVQSDKSANDEYEVQVIRKSCMVAMIVSIVIGLVLFLGEFFLKGTANYSLLALMFSIYAAQELYEGAKTNSKKRVIGGIVCGLFAVACIALQVGSWCVG